VSFILTLFSLFFILNTGQEQTVSRMAGVYQGKPLFIQNTYDPVLKEFCVKQIFVNNNAVNINYNRSALKIDFVDFDLNTPISLRIIHTDSCTPVVINPDAIFFHSIFSFEEIQVLDSVIQWRTIGEKGTGEYVVEYIENGLWSEQVVIPSQDKFEGAVYRFVPKVTIGSNKFRIKYIFPGGDFLYSQELDLHFYPEPVTFHPKATSTIVYFSRAAYYQIYDAGSTQVLDGSGTEVDVSKLPRGDYVIYFDGNDPGMFTKK
jgi:hypothetical protein